MRSSASLAFWTTALAAVALTAAFGPRATVREIMSSGVSTAKDLVLAEAAPVPSPVAGPPPFTAVCKAMRDKLGDRGFQGSQRDDMAKSFRVDCLGLKY